MKDEVKAKVALASGGSAPSRYVPNIHSRPL